ncbi:glycoside hydrolase family 2 protein [Streptomyces himalayensis]|uniref:Beta galactosidase jelly roll domain-containing protein n=1 Tax=Streptomyces himalayensis subsp. himalayensis TaxID=2756131 RepID=A0A7W0DIB0_9ACTN|nr:glycoside hydrolase family 2 TIM barrel-domain containing protein [Streptomyces himalayensis]MBA2945629.1 beta galactosidase jelly roll domain-containing protein [Streptomyces himalayensis subsp. himalayensis]
MRRPLRPFLAVALTGLLVVLSAPAGATADGRSAPDAPVPDSDGPGRQVPAGQRITDLGGIWEFTTDPDAATWDKLPVPGNWDMRDKYANHQGDAWYRRSFDTPRLGDDKIARLHFEAVSYTATVWLNGTRLGTHIGGYTPFEYNVTELLKTDGGPNTLIIKANNDEAIGATWPWGGISRPVTLTVDPAVRIERQHVTAEPELEGGTAEVATKVTLSNASDRERTVRLSGTLTDRAGRPLHSGALRPEAPAGPDVTVPAGSTKTVRLTTTLPKGSHELWSTDRPTLYRSTLTLTDGEELTYALSDRFGVRKIEVLPDGLTLNGERIRTAGFNRVPGDRVYGATEPLSVIRAEIDRMKQAGADMTRIHHVPQSPDLLDYLDEVGMLNIAEISVWGKGASLDPERWKPELREMVHRDANHASIFAWSVANEIKGTEEVGRNFVRTLIDYTRAELDDSRPLTYVSNTFSEIDGPEDEALQYTDFISVNMYRDYTQRLQRLRTYYPDKPVFVSEFSSDGYAFTPDRESVEYASRYDGQIPAELSGLPWVIGASRWTFDDYRSRFQGTSVNQLRGWGVQTEWGGLKRSYDQMRAAFAPVRGLSLAPADGGTRITVTPRSAGELPSRVLRGYRLDWRAVNADGDTVAERRIPLPDVTPGDTPVSRDVGWQTNGWQEKEAITEYVGLVDPQGYEVAVADRRLAAPAAPRVSQTVAADGAVRVVFDHVAGADSYRVEATQEGTDTGTLSRTVYKDDHGDITGLVNATRYKVRVVAVSAAGETASEWTAGLIPGADAGPLPPDAQVLVPVADGAVFQWRGGGADHAYAIEVADARSGELIRSWTTSIRGFSRIEDLGSGRQVRVRIRGLRADNTASAWSEWVEARTK